MHDKYDSLVMLCFEKGVGHSLPYFLPDDEILRDKGSYLCVDGRCVSFIWKGHQSKSLYEISR